MWKLSQPEDDGRLIADVSDHSHNKHYFLMRYLDAFTLARIFHRR